MTPPDTPTEGQRLAALLDLAARRIHSSGHAGTLFPAQWTALRYLAAAGEAERTAVALARFQRLAPGAVARTVRTLVEKGLVAKAGRAEGSRGERLALTRAGFAALKRDPLAGLADTLAALPEADRATLERALSAAIEATTPPLRKPRRP